MDAKELIEKIEKKIKAKELDDEWFLIRDEIIQLLKEDLPQEVRTMFAPLGYLERVFMLCDGIDYMRAQEQENKDKDKATK